MDEDKTSKILITVLAGFSVVAGLVALLFPAVGRGLEAGAKAQAKNDVTQIATASAAFLTEYGHLPSTNETARLVDGDVLLLLMGTNVGGLNPRGIVFLEVAPARKGKGGLSGGAFVDPWDRPYEIIFDGNGDGVVTAGLTNVIVKTNVAVWNNPDPAGKLSAKEKARRKVESW